MMIVRLSFGWLILNRKFERGEVKGMKQAEKAIVETQPINVMHPKCNIQLVAMYGKQQKSRDGH